MDLIKLWTENKKTIVTTVIVVVTALVLIKFFDVILWVGIVAALAVAAVLGWNHLTKKYGGPEGVWDAFLKEVSGK